MTDLPEPLTDEQRDEYLRAAAQLSATVQQMIAAIAPACQTLAAQVSALYGSLQAAGLIDEHGRLAPHGADPDDFALCPPPQPDLTAGDDHA